MANKYSFEWPQSNMLLKAVNKSINRDIMIKASNTEIISLYMGKRPRASAQSDQCLHCPNHWIQNHWVLYNV